MKTLILESKSFLEEREILNSPMLEMANLSSHDTGLSTVIWIGKIGGQHGPRIKVSNIKGRFAEDDNFVVSVSKEPSIITPKSMKLKSEQIADVFDWIKLNYTTLMLIYDACETDKPVIPLLNSLEPI